MAQYFEVLSQRESSEQNRHFFSTSDENQQTQQVRYILADESQTFQQQQLVQLSGDQVMLVDGSQQQVQQLVIESNQLTYQQTQNQAQPFMQMSNANAQTRQIFYMESSEVPTQENVQTVIEQTPTMQQAQAQPIVLNHQLGASSNRQTSAQRPLLIRNNSRPTQINMANQPVTNPRAPIPQQVTRSSAVQMRNNVANPLRMRSPSLPQIRTQQPRSVMQQRSAVLGIVAKDSNLVSQEPQLQSSSPLPSSPTVLKQVQKQIGDFEHSQDKNSESPSSGVSQEQLLSSQIVKPDFQKQSPMKSENVDELDDHDPSMNSNPAQMANYKRILEQKQQMTKMGLLSRLPSQIKITQTPQTTPQQQILNQIAELPPPQEHQQQSPMSSQTSLPQQQQILQTGGPASFPATPQLPQRKPRAPARPRNQNAMPRNSGAAKPKAPPRTPQPLHPYPRAMGQQARFPLNQQQQQLANQGPVRKLLNQPQNQVASQKMAQQQQQQQHQPQQQQINDIQQQHAAAPPQSQINYLIPPPTPNRPRQQRPLPSYIPSSQIQQIIENTPLTEEYSDSIRMLVLLENGEQRLITFTLPKEACTIQEILEQVNVPFTPETNIQVTEANTNGINYIVTVGNVTNFGYGEDECQDNIDPSQSPPPAPLPPIVSEQQEMIKPASPEPPKEQPKLVPGKLAVCSYCGYTGEDFNRCARCNRKLPDNVKSIDSPLKNNGQKFSSAEKKSLIGLSPSVPKPTTPIKKKPTKAKPMDNESVVISSDEEEDEKKSAKSVSEQLLKSLGASVTISPVTKEPSLTEMKKHICKDLPETVKSLTMVLKCRTVRVGSYRFAPPEEIIIDSRSVSIKAPPVGTHGEFVTLTINRSEIVKVLVSFNKGLPVVFYYLNVDAAPVIRELLNLQLETGLYYDPISEKDESFKKITLLPDEFLDEQKAIFQQIYGAQPFNIMDELTSKEANDILLKTCPKDGNSCSAGTYTEIKQILFYPPEGPARLTLNTEDYVCLAADQFLNDKIIDFYLKYLWENLPPETQSKVHIFSTFFYKRLTTKPSKANKKSLPHEVDPNLTAAEKRHSRVKNWSKRTNLFEKDFIVVPINENAHWFLAIICFPNLQGMQTFDGKPYVIDVKPKKGKKHKAEKPIPCDDPLLSDKDEAESEASDLESDDSDSSTASAAATNIAASVSITPLPRVKKPERPPIKQPCILIFDSLAGPSRSRVVATLRDYLTVEYKNKIGEERIYNKDSIKGSVVKVPQQTNFTDCGLYLLQFVEHFFKSPIQDYYIPIKSIKTWFEEITVTKKREDIANLIKELMDKNGGNLKLLPDIILPTMNGKLIEKTQQSEEEHESEDMFTDIEDSEMTDPNLANSSLQLNESSEMCQSDESSVANTDVSCSPIKPSIESVSDKGDIVATVMNSNLLRPTFSEFPRITNKDTLNYLKAKRIVRHKQAEGSPEIKKIKFENSTK
ncbi:uncharacterized protein LOC132696950 [Cylas formicarius]|uniref:uncharacterized protein LOC132696950 n=1 Tax=Cylas formicarius TaxID=197179 RepID=UPI0029585B10|nr:uncharacterized protein LOC132696950 [Cylas formicarius]